MTHRTRGEEDGDRAGADADRGAQPAEPDRADVEPFLGDGGQQRDRSTEQDREQIERDRTQQDRLAANEAQTFDRVAHRRRLAFGHRALTREGTHPRHGERRGQHEHRGGHDGTHTPMTYRNPPITGPTIDAPCHVADCRAVSHGSRAASIESAGRDRLAGVANARAPCRRR